jgi:hypothetical protein
MIKNKGQHEHEYFTRCECQNCICDRFPHNQICYFCENDIHYGHICIDYIVIDNDKLVCNICNNIWIKNV